MIKPKLNLKLLFISFSSFLCQDKLNQTQCSWFLGCVRFSGKQSRKHLLQPFNSHKWPRQNFSLQYQDNTKLTRYKNKEKYQLGDYFLIQYQILLLIILWLPLWRITSEILGMKGLALIILQCIQSSFEMS